MTLLLLLVSIAFAVFVHRSLRHSPRLLGPAAGLALFLVSWAAFQGPLPKSADRAPTQVVSDAAQPLIPTHIDPATMKPTGYERAKPATDATPTGATAIGPVAQASAQTISVPSDTRVRYSLIELKRRTNGYMEITTRRDGQSGTSFSTRLVDCAGGRFGYLADGDSEEEFEHSRKGSTSLEELSYGSASYWIALRACGQRLVLH